MKEEIRRVVARTAAARINGQARSHVFSFDRGSHAAITDNYDFEAGAHITQRDNGFYQHDLGAHVSLNIDGDRFSGFDHESGSHFSGSVNGNTVTLFDHGEGRYFHYSA